MAQSFGTRRCDVPLDHTLGGVTPTLGGAQLIIKLSSACGDAGREEGCPGRDVLSDADVYIAENIEKHKAKNQCTYENLAESSD